jgi:putative heme-binding domain-containing protein
MRSFRLAIWNWALAAAAAAGFVMEARLFAQPPATAKPAAAATNVRVPEGFVAELVYEVPAEEQGSWVSLTVDPKGRLLASDQYGAIYRLTIADDPQAPPKVERMPVEIGMSQGMLCAFDALYVSVNGDAAQGAGIYRVTDTNNDDQYDHVEQLIKLVGGGEHGPHALILSPDGQSIYFCGGNNTDVPEKIDRSRVPRRWDEDHIVGRMPDAGGHNVGRLAPGGFVLKFQPDGSQVELVATGFRNEYDIAFNQAGELFSYDADMEWDVGLPWYRPTRINHVISGAEFGWRNGSGKWPAYYPDSFGAAIDIGPGSPTGITFGYGAKFPEKYQQALFISDWSYGNIYAAHLEPSGASYTGSFEAFATGMPLAVTDVVIRPQDGAMYFAVGGRRTHSALYRIRYVGKESTDQVEPSDPQEILALREIRHQLEAFHGVEAAAAVPLALRYLDHEDRAIRFAARVALEHQPVERWRTAVLDLEPGRGLIQGIIALARNGQPADRAAAFTALQQLDFSQLPKPLQLDLLRAYGLVALRLGTPDDTERAAILQKLDSFFPAGDPELDRELSQLLAYLRAPKVIDRTIALLQSSPTQEEQIHYAFVLREQTEGWTPDTRRAYFQWFQDAASARGGHSFGGYVENMRNLAIDKLTLEEKAALADVLAPPTAKDPLADLAPRTVVQEWKLPDLQGDLTRSDYQPDLKRGAQLFAVAQCNKCHQFRGMGGILGPNLTAVSGRFSPQDLLESILNPNKEISDQYAGTQLVTTDGRVITGKIVNLAGEGLMVMTNMFEPDNLTTVNRNELEESKPSPVSLMPAGLLDTLTREEILDLMAYLRSGNPKSTL